MHTFGCSSVQLLVVALTHYTGDLVVHAEVIAEDKQQLLHVAALVLQRARFECGYCMQIP